MGEKEREAGERGERERERERVRESERERGVIEWWFGGREKEKKLCYFYLE